MWRGCLLLINMRSAWGAQGGDRMADVNTAFDQSGPFSGSGEEPQDNPPPPYESVVMHDGVRCSSCSEVSFELHNLARPDNQGH
jgi:hypothetical protein